MAKPPHQLSGMVLSGEHSDHCYRDGAVMAIMDCTEWQPYFAWWPVTVDAYTESERKNGKFSYPKLGWVERRLHIWIDDDDEQKRVWRFRLPRSEAK